MADNTAVETVEAEKTETKTNGKTATKTKTTADTFTKSQILKSKKYQIQRDILAAVLDDNKKYNIEQIEAKITEYLK